MDRTTYGAIEPEGDEQFEPLLSDRRPSLRSRFKQPYVVGAVIAVIVLAGVSGIWFGLSSASSSSTAAPVGIPAAPNSAPSHGAPNAVPSAGTGASARDAAAAASGKRSGRPIEQILTRKDTKDRLSRQADLHWGEDYPSDVTVTLEPSITFQTILGFGGAITDAAVHVLSQLDDKVVQRVIDLYYGPDGIRYNLARIHINSCDYSLGSYSYNDTPNDFNLDNFDFGVTEDTKLRIPFARRALNASNGQLRFYGVPWSPPAWMKGNNQMTSSSTPCLKQTQDQRYQRAWALYMARWMQAWRKHGLPMWGLSPQNEVEFAAPWEACVWTPQEMRDFIKKHLGPTLEKEVPGTKLMIYDHNKDHIVKWASTIYSDPDSAKYVWGTAFHWYSGDSFDNLATVHDSFPDKHLLASEACHCPGVQIDDWARGEAYGHDILGDLNHFSVGWTDWNIVLNHEGGPNHLGNFCDAPIIADLRPGGSRDIHIQPTYYYMGHFSRYLPPGSVRIHAKVTGNKLMEVTAFRTPSGRIVVIALNRSDYQTEWKLKIAGRSEAVRVTFYEHSIVTLLL